MKRRVKRNNRKKNRRKNVKKKEKKEEEMKEKCEYTKIIEGRRKEWKTNEKKHRG